MSLTTLTSSLQSAAQALPQVDSSNRQVEGISLLDTKNELLLSYLQSLAFFILLKLNQTNASQDTLAATEPVVDSEDVVKRLVELRLYLEKGVRPLESRMKYQIDKSVRAAALVPGETPKDLADKGREELGAKDVDEEDSDAQPDELAFRPNLQAFTKEPESATRPGSGVERTADGIYKPPRITPKALPSQSLDERARTARKPQRSHAVDDYINTELSQNPIAEPSIGSTLVSGGRHTKSDKERREEEERTTYEEANFTRLPPPSKKERAKKGARRPAGFGGEELRGLGEGLDRIERLTSKRRGGGERSVEDGPRGSGHNSSSARGPKRRKTGRT